MLRTRIVAVGLAVGTVLALGGGSSAEAIVYGVPADGYENVGSLLITRPPGHPSGDATFQLCTGTVIAPDVVLTASHCLVDLPPGYTVDFTLDEVIDADGDGFVDDDVSRIAVTTYPHPSYATGGANNTYDIGVVRLHTEVSVTPAPLPAPGVLDTKVAKAATYVTVGYGAVRDTRKTAWQALGPGTRRMEASQTVNSVNKSWITFSMNQATGNGGTCYGDSGGPHFDAGGTVVSITVTGDSQCKSTDKTYRIDTADALDFLTPFLSGS